MKAVSRRKTARKVMQPKGAVETGIQKLPRLPRALRFHAGFLKDIRKQAVLRREMIEAEC